MELKLSKNQIQEFLNNPVWIQIKADLTIAFGDGLARLQQVDPTSAVEIAKIQSGLERISEFSMIPEKYLEELNEDEELS